MKTGNARFRNMAIAAFGLWLVLYSYNAMTSGVAEKVIAEEITGVVVEKGTGKPVPNAVVMIRFERGNTGHGSPACFRSVATESDANGRFRFEPWTQEDTRADSFYGEISAYKKGYAIPRHEGEYIHHSQRSFLGIRFSKNLYIPKTERRVELREWSGTEEDRMEKLRRVAGEFSCGTSTPGMKEFLYMGIRKEILESPLVDKRLDDSPGLGFTNRTWIEQAQKYFAN